ncbi:glycosyltransferase family 2 protein [Eggerthella timonensis]|uniref:glycosyltransferase family 2 protein n=1 Tax=Eggerthella timonensis TaxID=1871008 RepID=UPI000C77D867|nr:glycosyltransferase family 2 protein [Eggerthella timonensis]
MDTSNAYPNSKQLNVLVVIPAYNEQESIVSVVNDVASAGYDYVVVNDGSTDETLSICKAHGFNVLNLPQNLGIGGCVQAGHKYALLHGYDVDIQFDGDGQHDARCIPSLVELIESGSDLAIGSRFVEDTDGFRSTALRRLGIVWLSFWIKAFSGKRITDPTSGFRASSKTAMALFARNYPTDYPEPESIMLAIKSGLSVNEAPATMRERQGGKSSIGGLSSLYYMIKVSLAISIVSFSHKRKRV